MVGNCTCHSVSLLLDVHYSLIYSNANYRVKSYILYTTDRLIWFESIIKLISVTFSVILLLTCQDQNMKITVIRAVVEIISPNKISH